MEWKDKQEAGMIAHFLQNWGRGARHQKKKPDEVLAKWQAKAKLRKELVKKAKPKLQPMAVGIRGQAMVWDPMAFMPKSDPKKPFESGYNFGARLSLRGYKHLGSGCFSDVYAKADSEKVIKVTRRPDNWIDYIHWASEHGYAGKFAPKVYSYKKYPSGFSVAVVERMEKEYSAIRDEKSDISALSYVIYPAMRDVKIAQKWIDEIVPGLSKFFIDFKKKFGHGHDICGSNMMLRKDGSFCVTDPVAGNSTLTVKRLRSRDFTSLSPASLGYFYETHKVCFRS